LEKIKKKDNKACCSQRAVTISFHGCAGLENFWPIISQGRSTKIGYKRRLKRDIKKDARWETRGVLPVKKVTKFEMF